MKADDKVELKEGLKEMIRTLETCVKSIEAIETLGETVDYDSLRKHTRNLDKEFKETLSKYGELVEPVSEYVLSVRRLLHNEFLKDTCNLDVSELIETGKRNKKVKVDNSWDI